MKISFACRTCGKVAKRERGHINRSKSIGAPLYCSMACSGLGRRKNKTIPQRKYEKRLYDIQYRALNLERINQRKREYHRRTYNSVKAAACRKTRMSYHVEYCRQLQYKSKKRYYDRQYLAQKHYGAFAEAAIVLRDIENEVQTRIDRNDIYAANGTQNKWLQRRRQYEQVTGNR